MGPGVIVGIVIGTVVFLTIVILLIVWCRRRNAALRMQEAARTPGTQSYDQTTVILPLPVGPNLSYNQPQNQTQPYNQPQPFNTSTN